MKVSYQNSLFTAILITLIFGVNPAFAQTTYTWNGGAAAPWDSASHWTPVGVPGSGDTAIINSGTVTLTSNVEVSGLTLAAAVIDGSGNLTVTGLFNWSNGRIEGSGSVFIAPGATLELGGSADKELNGRTLVNNGAINWTGNGLFRMRNGAVIQNPAGKTITIQNNSTFKYSSPGGGSVINDGAITKSTGGGLTDFEILFTNNGTVNLNSGTLQFKSGSDGSNSIYNTASGSIIIFSAGTHNLDNVEFNGGFIQFIDGTFNVNGGGITVDPASSLEMSGSSAVIQGTGPLTIGGNLTWNRGTITGAADFMINGSLTLSGIYVKMLDGRTLTNTGTINWIDTGNLRLTNNAVLINQSSAVINLQADAILDFFDPSGGTFNNAGTINRTAGLVHSIFDVYFENTGTVNVSSGNLRLTRGSNHTGTLFNVSAGSNILLDGGIHTFNNAAFSGAGRTRHLSNTVNITGAGITINPNGTYEMAGGFLIGDGPIINDGTFDWAGGSISGTGQITSNGSFLFSGSALKKFEQRTLSNNGVVTWLSSGEIRLGSSAQITNQTTGLFDIQNDAAMNFIPPDNSTFNNSGSITKSAGAGTSTLNVTLNNSGAVYVNSGTLQLANGGNQNNASINVAPNAFLIFDGAVYNADNLVFEGGGIAQINNASLVANGAGISVAPAATLALINSNSVLQGSGPVTVGGTLLWSRGTISDAGTVDINGVLEFEGSSSKTLLFKTVNNYGTLLWTGDGALRFNNNAQLLNKPGATIDLQTGTVFQALSASPGNFDNAGTLTKSGGQDSLVIDIPYTSSGGININTGKLRFTEPGSISGSTINLGSGTFFEYDDGAHVLNNASFSGNGTVVLKQDFLTINGTTTPFSSGATLKIIDGILNGTSSIIADGLEWQRGTISGSGSVTVNNTLKLNTNNFKALVQKSLINNGTATWSDSGDIRLQDGASLQNQAGATFEILNDAPVRFILPAGGSVFNAGSMIKHTGSGITQFETDFGNSGILEVQTGTLTLLKPLVNDTSGTIKGSGTLDVSAGGFTNHGNINPGTSPGKLTIIGNAGQTATAALNVELGGVVPGSSYDQLVISNAGVLSGALNITYANGFVPSPGDEFTILTANPRINQFTSVNVPPGPADFTVSYTPNSVVLHTIRSNVAPNVVDDFANVDEDILQEINVLSNDSDSDGDTLIITSHTQPLHGTVTQTGDSTFSYLSDLNFFGADSFSYSVIDGYGGSGSATVYITVQPVNDPPAISGLPDTLTFTGNTSADLDVWQYVSDPETADSLLNYAFSVSNDSLLKSYNTDSGILTLSAVAGFTGDVTLRIRATDPENVFTEDTLTVVVSPVVGIYGPNGEIPLEFALEQNYPNPFNPATTIKFRMPAAENVRLVVYNILGQKVRILVDERLEAGYHQVYWDGLNDRGQQLSSGIYVYRIEAGNFKAVRKMTLLK